MMMVNIEKLEVLEYFLNRDYYKPIRTDAGFDGRNDNYTDYTSKADRYENLSSRENLNVIRPYLRNLINDHKPVMELNNNNNNNNNNNDNNNKIIIIITVIEQNGKFS